MRLRGGGRSAGKRLGGSAFTALIVCCIVCGLWMAFPCSGFAQTVVSQNIVEDTLWDLEGSPYLVTTKILIRSASKNGPAPVLTIDAGVEVRFASGGELQVGHESYGVYPGGLSAAGTADAPIVFTSAADSPAPGDWNGIFFHERADSGRSRFEHCVVEYGGAGIEVYGGKVNTNLLIRSSGPSIRHCILRHSSGHGLYTKYYYTADVLENQIYENHGDGLHFETAPNSVKACSIRSNGRHGIYLRRGSPQIGGAAAGEGNAIEANGGYGIYLDNNYDAPPTIQGNIISGNGAYPLRISAGTDFEDNRIFDNRTDAIELLGGLIAKNTLWNTQVPVYVVTGSITVGSSDGTTAVLTIEPGVAVRFAPQTMLQIGNAEYGKTYRGALDARGTAEAPIVFTSNAASPAPGDWSGLYFHETANGSRNRMEHCVVEFGGAGIDRYGGPVHSNILLLAAGTSIRATEVCYGSGHGIFSDYYFNATIAGCTVHGNAGDGLHMKRPASTVKSCAIHANGGDGIFLSFGDIQLGGEVEGDGNTIADNGAYGIFVNSAVSLPRITQNHITGNGAYAVRVGAGAELSANTVSGNAIDAVELLGATISRNTVWSADVPAYHITGDVAVAVTADSGESATLVIEPGVELRFAPGTGLTIGHPSLNGYRGALSARGTPEDPIVFTSRRPHPWGQHLPRDRQCGHHSVQHHPQQQPIGHLRQVWRTGHPLQQSDGQYKWVFQLLFRRAGKQQQFPAQS